MNIKMVRDRKVKRAGEPAAATADPPAVGAEGASQFAFVRSLERGLAVIKSFGELRPEQTVADVAKAVGIDRSAARRFLLTLARLGYVEQEGRFFRLQPQTLQLGYAYLSSLPWWRGAQRIAERLRDRVGQNCAVGVLDGDHVLYVAYASTARFPLLNRRWECICRHSRRQSAAFFWRILRQMHSTRIFAVRTLKSSRP
jgi:IclR family pca regulon transcriptional regulator